MTEQQKERVSAVAQQTTPGGVPFDALRWSDPQDIQARAQTLDRMLALVQEREPGLAHKLTAASSAEYMTSDAIASAQDLGVKADLVRIQVEACLSRQDFYGAVSILRYADVNRSDIPECQNYQFVWQQYEAAMKAGKLWDAWKIAEFMTSPQDRGKIITHEQVDHLATPYSQGWKPRELNARDAYAEAILKSNAEHPEATRDWQLDLLWEHFFTNEEEGYLAPQPSALALRVAKAHCQTLARDPDRVLSAIRIAAESRLPQKDIEELKKLLPPKERLLFKLQKLLAEATRRLAA